MIVDLFKKQLTIKDILDIDKRRIDRSKDLKVRLIENYHIQKEETWFNKFINFFKNKPKLAYYEVFKYKVNSESTVGKDYVVCIRVYPSFDADKFLMNKVKVYCQCPDFMYRAAYGLFKKSNIYINKKIKKSLGDALKVPPTDVTTTNSCKHLYAALSYFKLNLKKYNLVKSGDRRF